MSAMLALPWLLVAAVLIRAAWLELSTNAQDKATLADLDDP